MKKLILFFRQLFCKHHFRYTEINHDGMNTVECKYCGKRKSVVLFIALALVMCGCIPRTPYSIVTKVEKSESQHYTISYKYVVTTDNSFCFYTDETFYVGNTIQISKRTNP